MFHFFMMASVKVRTFRTVSIERPFVAARWMEAEPALAEVAPAKRIRTRTRRRRLNLRDLMSGLP
jgi:hypothetical protein